MWIAARMLNGASTIGGVPPGKGHTVMNRAARAAEIGWMRDMCRWPVAVARWMPLRMLSQEMDVVSVSQEGLHGASPGRACAPCSARPLSHPNRSKTAKIREATTGTVPARPRSWVRIKEVGSHTVATRRGSGLRKAQWRRPLKMLVNMSESFLGEKWGHPGL